MNFNKRYILISIITLVAILALLFYFIFFIDNSEHLANNDILTDAVIEQANSVNQTSSGYISVMIENATEVRPQKGLTKAKIIFESLVEGSITRFLAIYDIDDLPSTIGPIRSARPYFIDWADSFGGLYWHAGGSPQALSVLKNDKLNIYDMEEISYKGVYFYRDDIYPSPHNLFTNLDLVLEAWQKFGQNNYTKSNWQYKNDLSLEFRTVADKHILIPYPHANYTVNWQYDRDTNTWLRYNNNIAQYDDNNQILSAKNIIVLLVETTLIDKERLGMQTIGSGTGYLFRDGQKQELVWSKDSSAAPLNLTIGGNPIQLNYGNIWINVLPSYLELEYN